MKSFLCVLIICSFLGSSYNLFSIGPVNFYAFRIIFILFAGCFFLFKHSNRKERVHKNLFERYKLFLAAFILFTAMTLAQTPSIADWISGCVFWIVNIMMIFFVYTYTDTEKDLEKYVYSYMLGIFITMIISIFEYATGYHIGVSSYYQNYSVISWEYQVLGRFPTAFLYNPNNVGVVMMIGVALGGVFLKRTQSRMQLFVLWSALCAYVAFATGSRGAIIFVVFLFGFTVFSLPSDRAVKFFRVSAIIAVAYVFTQVFSDFLNMQIESSGLLNSVVGRGKDDEGRVQLIKAAMSVAKDSCFFGTGPGTAETMISNKFGYTIPSVHNFVFELLVTEGIFGSICFWWFYLRCLKVQYKIRDNLRVSGALFIALIAFLFVGIIPPTIITLHCIWIIFGFALAAEKVHYIKTGKLIR